MVYKPKQYSFFDRNPDCSKYGKIISDSYANIAKMKEKQEKRIFKTTEISDIVSNK